MLSKEQENYFNSKITQIKDYPKPGIVFKDITTLLNDSEAFCKLIEHLVDKYKNDKLDFIVGCESRGFIFASALCYALKVAFVPIRKKGKLPRDVFSIDYELEYGTDSIEIHKDAFLGKKANVLLVDDLIATGGTAIASVELIKKLGVNSIKSCFLLDIVELGGSDKLKHICDDVYSVIKA